jgi:hypothetical protein
MSPKPGLPVLAKIVATLTSVRTVLSLARSIRSMSGTGMEQSRIFVYPVSSKDSQKVIASTAIDIDDEGERREIMTEVTYTTEGHDYMGKAAHYLDRVRD